MKELTKREKAKAYDEALDRAQKVHRYSSNLDEIKRIEDIFPELIGSEDNEIKKELIHYFSDGVEFLSLCSFSREEIIAWLEKQGQVNETIISQHENKICKENNDSLTSEDEKIRKELIAFIKKRNRSGCDYDYDKWIDWLEKQGEEEYALKSFKDEDVRKFMQYIEKQAKAYEFNLPNRSYDIYAFAKDILIWLEKQGEQKPAWSEEDETVLNNLIYALANDRIGNNRDEYVDWLKSLKDRVQPKQEWSEEDKQYFNFLEKLLENLQVKLTENEIKKGTNSNSEYYYKVIQWLKSLKERYTWKPSDEQMKQLGWIAKQNKDNMIGKELMTLYNDLKKLKE